MTNSTDLQNVDSYRMSFWLVHSQESGDELAKRLPGLLPQRVTNRGAPQSSRTESVAARWSVVRWSSSTSHRGSQACTVSFRDALNAALLHLSQHKDFFAEMVQDPKCDYIGFEIVLFTRSGIPSIYFDVSMLLGVANLNIPLRIEVVDISQQLDLGCEENSENDSGPTHLPGV